MTLKSLLTTVVVASAAVSAYAFPTITVSPTPGNIDNVAMFASININGTGVTIVEDCPNKPYFENLDTGDVVESSEFYNWNFMNSNIMLLKFDTNDITENGEWELAFPAGCFQDTEGSLSSAMYFTYNLRDKNLDTSGYPQITLISSNPANGASLPYWGPYIDKMTFQTSNDDAVNYIGWTLYDITNGTGVNERIWMRQGSENRFDPNRLGGSQRDQWADGLFISLGGSDEKLIQGHTYRVELQFCGIGYDLATNQYPTSQQIQQSLELETYLDFKGQTPGTEYSYWTVENITPDPETYEFDNLDMRTFTIKYTGYVKPTMFDYPLGMGAGTASAGTISPASDPNVDGYAEAWDFTFDTSVLKQSTGELTVVIKAQDEDGLYVKGNGGYTTDDFEYKIAWKANAGADKLISIEPLDGATVEQLGTIVIGNDGNKTMFLAYQAASKPRIVKMGRDGESTVIELDEPVFSEDEKTASWTFDVITAPGAYSLIIPKWYMNCGTEFSSSTNSQVTFTYYIEGEDPNVPVEEDILPASVSLENDATLTAPLKEVVVSFNDVTFASLEPLPTAYLYREVSSPARAAEYQLVEEVIGSADDFWDPTIYTFKFSKPVEENGNYKFVIPARTFFDGAYDESQGETGHASPEMVYFFAMDNQTGVDVIAADNDLVTVYDVAGRVLLRNADAAQLKGLANGIYIVNGKKYVVK